jgi:hypothetical protein
MGVFFEVSPESGSFFIMRSQKKVNPPRRKYRRFALEFPLEVSGIDEQGHPFKTTGWIKNVSPEGGCLSIDKDIVEGTVLRLISPKGVEFEAIVCWGSYSCEIDSRLLGFELTGGQENWVLGGQRKAPSSQKKKGVHRFSQVLSNKIVSETRRLVTG